MLADRRYVQLYVYTANSKSRYAFALSPSICMHSPAIVKKGRVVRIETFERAFSCSFHKNLKKEKFDVIVIWWDKK